PDPLPSLGEGETTPYPLLHKEGENENNPLLHKEGENENNPLLHKEGENENNPLLYKEGNQNLPSPLRRGVGDRRSRGVESAQADFVSLSGAVSTAGQKEFAPVTIATPTHLYREMEMRMGGIYQR